ncbi:hypothetical protein HYU23_00815 [Candidatus Woesearchaeota archaeon]|nr:hypothetical protein [Candidatus Woesearchaeota archaeon]
MNFDQAEKQMRKKTERVSFRLNRILLNKIESFAETTEDTTSRAITFLIKSGLEHYEEKSKAIAVQINEQNKIEQASYLPIKINKIYNKA